MNFSTDGQDAISRSIDIQPISHASTADFDLDDFYDIELTARNLVEAGYERIALQFPDELLHDSVSVYKSLKAKVKPEQELYVMADTTYGSCCIDEITARHVDADAIVHFGHACLGQQTASVPVLYVFGKQDIDVEGCVTSIFSSLPETTKNIILRTDVVYSWQAEAIAAKLREGLEVVYNPLPTRIHPNEDNVVPRPTLATEESTTILYIGPEGPALTHLLITHGSSQVYSYDPRTKTARLESGATNKMLMRRYAMVQKAKDADVFGLVVGSISRSTIPLLQHIRTIISKAHKNSYTISVGKINPSKLANFLEIECWVYVSSCGEGGIVDSQGFYKPIVTPYELSLALSLTQAWTGRYVLDTATLLVEAQKDGGEEGDCAAADCADDDDNGDEMPVFSTITGKYRHPKRFGVAKENRALDLSASSAIVKQNGDGTVSRLDDSAAALFLNTQRTYQGLDPRLGQDKPSELEQGRSGIAKGYGEGEGMYDGEG